GPAARQVHGRPERAIRAGRRRSHGGRPMNPCPYRGLMPYREQDARFFFGRTRECETILDNLAAWRLTVLYGPSGVGKSSLLQAGVSHEIRRQTAQSKEQGQVPEFSIAILRAWRDHPLAGIERV